MIPASLRATTEFCARAVTRLSISVGYGLQNAANDLMLAIQQDDAQRVSRLFSDYGVDTLIEQLEARALKPLHDAARFHHANAMGALIDALPREMLNALDDDQRTPLIVAAANGHTDIVAHLLGLHAADTAQDDAAPITQNDAAAIAQNDATPIVQNNAGALALAGTLPPGFVEGMWAFLGYVSVDSSPPATAHRPILADVQDKNGDTALLLAMRLDFEEIVQLLVRYGVDVNIANHLGERPLTLALDRQSIEILQLLCEHGADVNAVDGRGVPPLQQAIEAGDLAATRTLLLAGANVHFQHAVTGATVTTLLEAQDNPALRTLVTEYRHQSRGAS